MLLKSFHTIKGDLLKGVKSLIVSVSPLRPLICLRNDPIGGNIALKIDIKKAFDAIDWNFLLQILKAFGFNSIFFHCVQVILESAKLSFSVNGHDVDHFPCKRGVHQGDPLSPLLFALQRMS